MIELVSSSHFMYVLKVVFVLGFVREQFVCGSDGQLAPLEHHMCPSENTETHECFRMTTQNATCAVTRIEGCIPVLHGNCQWQVTLEEVPCTVYKCEHDGCCEGWIEGEDGKCIEDSHSGSSIHCDNGGYISEDDEYCSCPEMFTGQRCETPICDKPCLNGGKCSIVDDIRQCVCPSMFYTGPQCEQVKCKDPCQNGGVCIPDGLMSRCKCETGFTGDACQYEMNNECPLVTTKGDTNSCKNEIDLCEVNADCPTNQVCCYNGCAGGCVDLANRTCAYNGRYYQAGESFSPESCKRCVCQPSGDVQCTKVVCPTTECEGGHTPITIEGHCCKVCPGIDLSDETGPQFENCPESFVTINVEEDGKTAQLNREVLQLKAVTHDGTPLAVSYSRTRFNHSKSRDFKHNMHIVTAFSDCDRNGRRAECNFMVIVRDPYPPIFTACPMEIFALNNEKLSWSDPVARDNVGIFKIQAIGDEIRDEVKPVDTYTVSYTVWDYDQNQAICAFAVHVFDKDSDPLTYPKEIKKRTPERHYSIAAIVGSVFVLTLLVLVVMYLAICIIKSRSINLHSVDSTSQEHIYAICGHGNHSYENFGLGKLPAYTPPSNPPPYEDIDHSFESPPIYEEISNNRTGDEHSYANLASGLSNPTYENETEVLKYMKV